jgi:ligand-binding SRPBCC domain-containing protein
MTSIILETKINAAPVICFDLARSIDLHKHAAAGTNEIAIAGRTSGLISKNEFVTWQATHFMITQQMSVRIIEMERPDCFTDEMFSGPFTSMQHFHQFVAEAKATLMRDEFNYTVPFGLPGKFFDWLVLRRYMTWLLKNRNAMIKNIAESREWRRFLTY